MRARDRWLLPEGVEEVLPPQAQRLEQLRRGLLDLYRSWGYELVVPPLIEYLESLLTGTAHDLDLQTFKLTDQLNGRMMGVRADMTPQVARIDAHRLRRDGPVRLCYLGIVLHTRPDGFAGSRSPLQLGAELFGHGGVASDVEILSLMLETLEVAGLEEIHVDLGHVGIFRGLARQARLNEEQETTLFDALQRKASPEIAAYLAELSLGASERQMFLALAELNGGEEVLPEARAVLTTAAPDVHRALDDLQAIASEVHARRPQLPLYFDLAELRGYHYHTGAVFAAFSPLHGQEIARGGRYDEIGKVFGRARPATGFSADLKTMMSLGAGSDGAVVPGGIFAPAIKDPALHARIHELRAQGERVICELPGQAGDARDMECDRYLEKHEGAWKLVTL